MTSPSEQFVVTIDLNLPRKPRTVADVRCPRCDSRPGVACNPVYWVGYYHDARIDALIGAQNMHDWILDHLNADPIPEEEAA